MLVAQDGYTSAYRDVTGIAEPTTVLTFRSVGRRAARPGPRRAAVLPAAVVADVVGMALDDDTDWDEVAELVTESYRFCAPQKLVRRLEHEG